MFDKLVDVSGQGIKIRIVQNMPNDEFPDLDTLDLQKMGVADVRNISFQTLIGSGVQHTKLLVVDQRHFYVGSANMDWRSLTQVGQCEAGLVP